MPTTTSNETSSAFATLAPWYTAECLLSLANNLFITGSIYYAKNTLHRSNADCLLITASWGFLYMFLSLIAGKLAGRWGVKRLAMRATLGCIVTGFLGLIGIAHPSLWLVILCLALFNITNTPLWPAIESAITRSPGKTPLSTRIALYNGMWSIGAAVAITFSGIINALDPRAIFLLVAGTSLIALIVLHFFAGAPAEHGAVKEDDQERAEEAIAQTEAGAKLLRMAWLANPLSYLANFVVIAVMPQLLASAGNLSTSLGGVWAIVRVLGFVILSIWTAWHYRVIYLIAAYLLMSVSFLLMLIMPNPVVFIGGQIIFGFTASFIYACSLYYSMHVSSGSGGHAGMHEALIGSGMFLGPLVGAIAAATGGGLSMVGVSVSVVLLLGFVALAAIARGSSLKGL